MVERGFADASLVEEVNPATEWWNKVPISSLNLQAPHTILPTVTIAEAAHIMTNAGFGQLPVVDQEGKIIGTVTEGNLIAKLRSGQVKADDPVTNALYKDFKKVDPTYPLGHLSRIFDRESFVLVVASSKRFKTSTEIETVEMVVGVATRIDLLKFISERR
jgi:cystathionine beta-synthase